MSSPRLSEILDHLKQNPEKGNFVAIHSDVYHLDTLIAELNNLAPDAEPLVKYDYLWKILNKFENVSNRFYSEKSLSRLDTPERYIPYALLMAIFKFAIESKNYANKDKGQTYLDALNASWLNDTWSALSNSLIGHAEAENQNPANIKKELADIASRYQDNINFDQAEIVLSPATVQSAISDLNNLMRHLESARLLEQHDITIINSILPTLGKLCSNSNPLSGAEKIQVDSYLQTFLNLRLQFANIPTQEKFVSPAMAVQVMPLVEAAKEMLGLSNVEFVPTAQDWNEYALTMRFGDSFKLLARRYPDASVFAEDNFINEEKQEDNELGQCVIPANSRSEHDALVKIKYNQTRLFNGPNLKEMLALVWFAISDLPHDKQNDAKKNLSAELQRIGSSDSDIDPTDVMLSLCSVIDGIDREVNLSSENVKDIESLVQPYTTSLIKDFVDGGFINPDDMKASIQTICNSADHQLANKFGFVWALHAQRIDVLNKLITPQAIVTYQNSVNAKKNAHLDLRKTDNLENYLRPYITKFLIDKIKKSNEKFAQYKIDLENDLYGNPTKVIDKLKQKINSKYAKLLGVAWIWHPEKQQTLDHLVSVESLIALQNTLNAEEDESLNVSDSDFDTNFKRMLEISADILIKAELQAPQHPKDEHLEDKAEEPSPVAANFSHVAAAADAMFAKKFKLVWMLRTDRVEIINNLFSSESVAKIVSGQKENTEKLFSHYLTKFLPIQLARGVNAPADIDGTLQTFINEANVALKADFANDELDYPSEIDAKEILVKLITCKSLLSTQNEINRLKDKALDVNAARDLKSLFAPHVATILETELKDNPGYLVLNKDKANPEEAEAKNDDVVDAPSALKFRQLKQKVSASLFEKFGIVSLWTENAVDVIDELTSQSEIEAAQNRLNKKKDENLDIAVVGNAVTCFEQHVLSLLEAKIKDCYEFKDNLQIDRAKLASIVSSPVSELMDIAEADKMMTDKFGILWVFNAKRREALDRVLTNDEISAAKNRVFLDVLTPVVQTLLEETFYSEFYNKRHVLESADKSLVDENVRFTTRVLPKVRVLVDDYLTKEFQQLWMANPERNRLLDRLTSIQSLDKAQQKASEKRYEQAKNMRLREPNSANELSAWLPILLSQMNDKLEALDNIVSEKRTKIRDLEVQQVNRHDAALDDEKKEEEHIPVDPKIIQLQSECQAASTDFERARSFVIALRTIQEKLNDNLADDDDAQFALLKASYLRLIALDKQDKRIADKAFVGTDYLKQTLRATLHRAYHSVLAEVEGNVAPEKSSDLIEQIEKIITETARFQNEKFLSISYKRSYIHIVKDQHKDSGDLARQLEQAIDIFNDYSGDNKSFIYKVLHFNRHHTDCARHIVTELTAMLKAIKDNPAAFADSGKVIQDAKDIIMNSVADLIKDGTLRSDFENSSFARRAAFTLNEVLSVAKLKIKFKPIQFKFNPIVLPEIKLDFALDDSIVKSAVPQMKLPLGDRGADEFKLSASSAALVNRFNVNASVSLREDQLQHVKTKEEIAAAEQSMASRGGLGLG
jgi:hypothetical protein